MAKDSNDTLYGVLSYIGPLVLIPLALQVKSKTVKAHMNQGLLLLLVEVLGTLVQGIILFGIVGSLINFAAFICSLVGIYHVLNEKKWQVPWLGHIAAKWKI